MYTGLGSDKSSDEARSTDSTESEDAKYFICIPYDSAMTLSCSEEGQSPSMPLKLLSEVLNSTTERMDRYPADAM
jgi:hypothetical protein